MKTLKTLIFLLLHTVVHAHLYAQEKPLGLSYIDSINNAIQTTAISLSTIECLPDQNTGEIEIVTIGSKIFCILRCPSNDKLFQFEIESMSWVKIPLLSTEDHKIKTIRKIRSLFPRDGVIYITLHWFGAEIIGNDDERPYVYQDKTIAISRLQAKK